MTKIALIADVHVANHKRWGGQLIGGLNDRARLCCDVIKACVERAYSAGCSSLYVLGDLFHSAKPTPPLIRAVMNALEHPKLRTYIILGNHDKQSEVIHDHACAPMLDADPATVIVRPEVRRDNEVDVWAAPYTPGEAKDWLTSAMAELGAKASSGRRGSRTIVLTHLGIFDDTTPSYLKGAHDAVSLGHVRWLGGIHKVDLFAAGNWHEQKLWSSTEAGQPTVLIPGTICPATFSDPLLAGLMFIYDSASNGLTHVTVPGPRFETVDMERLKEIHDHADDTSHQGWLWFYRAKVSRDEYQAACWYKDQLPPNRFLEVEVDRDADKLSVREAARTANAAALGDTTALAVTDLAEVKEPGTKEGVARRFEEYRKASL